MKKTIDRKGVKTLVEEGKRTGEIAGIMGLHRGTIAKIRNELGIPAVDESTVEEWVDEHVKVRAWTAKLKQRGGRLQYAGVLRRYCEWRGKSPEELLEEAWADTQHRKPHEKELPDILLLYKTKLEEEGKAPKTIAFNLAAVRSFYERNGYAIMKMKDLMEAAIPKEENGKEVIYPDQMRALISIATPLDKALFLTLYQSGLSSKEALSLKIRDIKRVEEGIIRLPERVRGKTGVKFMTFIGNDARGAIEAWLQKRNSGNLVPKNREASMDAVVKSDEDLLFISYDKRRKIWGPVTQSSLDRRMREYSRQLGWLKIGDGELGAKGLRNRYRPHSLRMSFSTILKNQNVPALHVEHMLGHAPAYNGAYDVVNENDLFETYKKAEKYLSISELEKVPDTKYEELLIQLHKRNGEITKLREEIEEMKAEKAETEPVDNLIDLVIEKMMQDEKIKKRLAEILK